MGSYFYSFQLRLERFFSLMALCFSQLNHL